MSTITEKSIITKKEEILTSPLGEGLAMMSTENGLYYNMDKIGRTIWEAFETPTSVENICNTLCQRFEVSEETCLNDVIEFTNTIKEIGLIEIS